jgi:hypothetical protein
MCPFFTGNKEITQTPVLPKHLPARQFPDTIRDTFRSKKGGFWWAVRSRMAVQPGAGERGPFGRVPGERAPDVHLPSLLGE